MLSEQFKIRTEKAKKETKLIPLTHIYTTTHHTYTQQLTFLIWYRHFEEIN